MKRLSKVVLLAAGFGLLAVVLSLISKRAVSADDHTNLWDHVVLDCSNPSDGIHCTSWTRVFPNGHSSAFSALPDGKKLVITDLEFNDLSRDGTPGYLAGCSINTTVADGDNVLLQAQGVADLGSDLFGQTHSDTGVALTYWPANVGCLNISGLVPSPNLPNANVTIRGYFVDKDVDNFHDFRPWR